MRRLILTLALVLLPGVAFAQEHTRQACVDGTNCYCDCVENTAGTGSDVNGYASQYCNDENIPIDALLIWCEDFEDPTYENPNPRECDGGSNDGAFCTAGAQCPGGSCSDTNRWRTNYGEGTNPCIATNNNNTLEGPDHDCRNISQSPRSECKRIVNGGLRPNSVLGGFSDYEYNASSDDLSTHLGHSTMNAEWDGCQSLYNPIEPGDSGGGFMGLSNNQLTDSTTLSMTMVRKYSANHFIGAQSSIIGRNVKGDRHFTKPDTNNFHTPNGGAHGPHNASHPACSRGDMAYSAKFPFASLIKANNLGSGIDGRGQCCSDDCFADAIGPTGLPRIGLENHDTDDIRRILPPQALWNPRVEGGVPMSIIHTNDATPAQDGRDEWMCFQWSLVDIGTNQFSYTHWINNTAIIRMENLKGSTDESPLGQKIRFGNSFQTGGNNPRPINATNEDYADVRDNYHLTASPTPATCAAVGWRLVPVRVG